jgi:DNA-binding protein HU-beta
MGLIGSQLAWAFFEPGHAEQAPRGCHAAQRSHAICNLCDTIFFHLFQEGPFVNKTELVEHIAAHADISKAAATRALDSTLTAIRTTLKKGGTVSLVGFGSFAVTKRPARKGRNPRTGAEIKIKAAKVPKFRPGKALKEALN